MEMIAMISKKMKLVMAAAGLTAVLAKGEKR